MTRALVCNQLLAWLLVATFAAMSASMYFFEQWYVENVFTISTRHLRTIRFGSGLAAALIILGLLIRPLLARRCIGKKARLKTTADNGRGVVQIMGLHFCVSVPVKLSAGEIVRIAGVGRGGVLLAEAPGRQAANSAMAGSLAGTQGRFAARRTSQSAPFHRPPAPPRHTPPQPPTNGSPGPSPDEAAPAQPWHLRAPARPPLFGGTRGQQTRPPALPRSAPLSPHAPSVAREEPEYEYVWISSVATAAPVAPFNSDLSLRDRKRAAECMDLTEYKGEPTPKDCIIKEAYVNESVEFVQKLPNTFSLNGKIAVSKEVIDLISEFNIGYMEIFPVKLFQKDRKTPINGEYFIINPFRNRRKTLLPEQSRAATLKGPQKGIYGDFWSLPFMPKDGEIAVSRDALDTKVDIWTDPHLLSYLFLSPALGEALKREGLARSWNLRKARVVTDASHD